MTTIATDGKTIAADRRRVSGSRLVNDSTIKIKVAHGRIYALTGVWAYFDAAIAWHHAGADPEKMPKTAKDDDWRLIVIERDGSGKVFFSDTPCSENLTYPAAFGSGSDYALAMLDAGFDPAVAVRAAIKRDIHSGGEIQVINIAEALGEQIKEAAE